MPREITVRTPADFAARQRFVRAQDRARRAGELNRNFVQLGRNAIRPFRALTRHAPIAAAVLLSLIVEMSKQNRIRFEVAALMAETKAGRTSIYNAISLLQSQGWICKAEGDPSTLLVNAEVFWGAAASLKRATFCGALTLPPEWLGAVPATRSVSVQLVTLRKSGQAPSCHAATRSPEQTSH